MKTSVIEVRDMLPTGGLLFNVAALPGGSSVLAAGLDLLGFLLSLGLPHLPVPRILEGGREIASETT